MNPLEEELADNLVSEIDATMAHTDLTVGGAMTILKQTENYCKWTLLNDFGVYPDLTNLEKVAEFHRMTGTPILSKAQLISPERSALRVKLITSETAELIEAINKKDLVGIADALTDLEYVIQGAKLEFGLGHIDNQLFDEVHRSNMTKGTRDIAIAEATVTHLQDGNVEEYGCIDCTIEQHDELYIVMSPTKKVMKPLNYSRADLASIVYGSNPGNV